MCKIEKVYIRKNTTYFYIDYPIIIIKTFYQIYMAKVCYIKTQKEVIIDIGIIREEPSKDLFYIYKLVEEEYGMILDFFEEKLDGDSWEEICQSCYRMMYRDVHYTEIPAVQGGDAGIEGFTQNGIVNQCYCAERDYSENELYIHQRDKMTHDINKLLSPEYKKRLLKFGVPVIREWHFVVPFYKDSRIIEHAETKRKEVLKNKEENPQLYDYIDANFIIVIKQAEDFAAEITKIIRKSLTDTKLNLAVRAVEKPNWEKCDSEKVSNILRKVKAVMGDVEDDDEDLNDIVDVYVEAYIKGIEIMRMLRVSFTEIYEDVYGLEQSYKKQVKIQTRLNTDRSMNITVFNEILQDFERQLKEACKIDILMSTWRYKNA